MAGPHQQCHLRPADFVVASDSWASSQVFLTSFGVAVTQPRVRPVAVGLDVGADRRPRIVESLELRAPDEALLQLREPGLDEGLGLGVAIAAAAVGDLQLLQVRAEAAEV